MLRIPLFTALATALLASSAMAKPWAVDAAHSTLTFTGAQAGTPFTGTFGQFTPTIDFDPAAPEKGHIAVTIDMASATIADDHEQNDALPTEDWFFTKQFAQAQFESTAIRAAGPNRYEATGTLTLRGVSKPVTLPFTLTPEGTASRAEGELVLDRRDFALGGKEWADDQWIAYPVTVRYRLLATPQP